jgi:hypothetical protein
LRSGRGSRASSDPSGRAPIDNAGRRTGAQEVTMGLSFDELDKLNIRVRSLRAAASPIVVESPVEILGIAYACR